jgi:hypothetical protein
LALQKIEEYLVKELVSDSSHLAKQYLEKLDREDILRLLDDFIEREEEMRIPLSIFRGRELSCLESVIVHLRDDAKLTNVQVSRALGRSIQVCWRTYSNAKKKYSGKLAAVASQHDVPVSLLRGKLSCLEAVVSYLFSRGLTYSEIARLLNRDDRTVWTVHRRAIKK